MDEQDQHAPTEEGTGFQTGGEETYVDEQLNYFKDLIETSDLPSEAKKLLYGLFDRTTVLSNYSEKDMRILLAKSRSIIAGIKIYMPPEKLTPDIAREIDNIEMLHYKMLRRGAGGFERRQQQTRITQATFNRQEEDRRGGILGGLFGR